MRFSALAAILDTQLWRLSLRFRSYREKSKHIKITKENARTLSYLRKGYRPMMTPDGNDFYWRLDKHAAWTSWDAQMKRLMEGSVMEPSKDKTGS